MAKSFVKKGDEVVVIAGSSKGKRGKILLVDPKKERVIVEGANLRKHHERKSEKNPEGAIHISNVMPAGRFDAKKSQKKA